eukprot:17375-Heterococcus_DN1.PRE.2
MCTERWQRCCASIDYSTFEYSTTRTSVCGCMQRCTARGLQLYAHSKDLGLQLARDETVVLLQNS